VGALLGLFQVVLGAAAHHLVLKFHVFLKHLLQGEDFRHLVVDGQHDNAHGILQLGVLVQLVQDDLCIGVLADIHHDAHTLAVGLIVQAGDALNAFLLDKVGHVLDEALLTIYGISVMMIWVRPFLVSSMVARPRRVILPRPVA